MNRGVTKMRKLLKHLLFKFHFLPDRIYLSFMYRIMLGKKLNFKNPSSFSEKMQVLKLSERNPVYTKMVDKLIAKDIIKNTIGSEYVVETLHTWDTVDEIDFNSLPNRFVLKTNHDSGGVFICRDKSDFNEEIAKKNLKKHLSNNYYFKFREWPYRNVVPKIFAEKYLENNNGSSSLTDYKIYCFNGVPRMILVCSDRFSETGVKFTYFDLDWNLLDIQKKGYSTDPFQVRPVCLDEMLSCIQKFNLDIPFLRFDFFEINNRLYLGEFTFFPEAGFPNFTSSTVDEKLGNLLQLN